MHLPSKPLLFALVGTLLLASPGTILANPAGDAAIQAIQQAPDPSAAVAAYANGVAVDRNSPQLLQAYVTRMVDLGLPEMAYHQAQTLTTLDANNGLAWGVVAYVDARRTDMPAAISAINLAGQLAPDNRFVVHTAGEIVAWYDFRADKSKVADNAKSGLEKIRALLVSRPVYTEAYETARNAYQTNTTPASVQGSPSQPAPTGQVAPGEAVPATPQAPQAQLNQVVPPLTPPVYPPDDYPYASYPNYDYGYATPDFSFYSDWGPGWIAPTPWCWWQAIGFWGGCSFFPFSTVIAFGDFDDFGHRLGFHDHFHDGFRGHGNFHHDHNLWRGGPGHDGTAAWHHDRQGRNSFFGTPARPNSAVSEWARAGAPNRAALARSASPLPASWNASIHNPRNSGYQQTLFSHPSGGNGRSIGPAPLAGTRTGSFTPNAPYRNWNAASSPNARPWTARGYQPQTYATARSGLAGSYNYSARTYSMPRYYGQGPAYSSSWSGGLAMNSAPRPRGNYSPGFGGPRGGGWMPSAGFRTGPAGSGFHGGGSFSGRAGGSFSGGHTAAGSVGGGGFHGSAGASFGGGHR
jgi:hypothetical protein